MNLKKFEELFTGNYNIYFVIRHKDEFRYLGRAWSKPEHIRFKIGWELKDCFDASVRIDTFKFAVLKEVIDKSPNYLFVISL